ncbi:MAG: dethiobiotin synthase [Candidatus Dadabacteria bacterium]|nr:dethiobiotin synthase [Candidatus Dadabacteria bacterium]MYB25996.1 dethiobiotin synthase [Candidatus Dadabacteria bacterium]MYE61477.1 dethiobiotin synthase [Candidatus Dadabacteria bacterium]MYI73209.1 dethiobiotin synthase [Candidatus Dadabacteria bacterium]
MKDLPKAVFITGTDTGVGKTAVTAALAALLREKGLVTGVIKPFQTGTDLEGLSDAEFIYAFLGKDCVLSEVSPCRLKVPLSPYRAASIEGADIPLEDIIEHTRDYISRNDVTLVEGAGGLCVPVTESYMMADLAVDLGAPMVIVVRPGLGTLNHTALSLEYARQRGARVLGVVINGFPEPADVASATNPAVLRDVFSVNILGVLPHLPGLDVEGGSFSGLKGIGENCFSPLFGGKFSADAFLSELSEKTRR